MILLIVEGQNLYRIAYILVDGTMGWFRFLVGFKSPEWEGLTKYVCLKKGEQTVIVPLHDKEQESYADGETDLESGVWNMYVYGELMENGSVVKRITTDSRLLEVRKEGDAGYDMEPSLIQ